MIPSGGQVSFEEIAEKTDLDKGLIRRLLRNAISMRILTEPEADMVAHTKTSRFLAIPYISSWVTFESHDTWPAIAKVRDLLIRRRQNAILTQTHYTRLGKRLRNGHTPKKPIRQ